MEKRRRARINQSLALLKTLILDSTKNDVRIKISLSFTKNYLSIFYKFQIWDGSLSYFKMKRVKIHFLHFQIGTTINKKFNRLIGQTISNS